MICGLILSWMNFITIKKLIQKTKKYLIQKLIIEDAPYGHYDLKLKLDDGRIISVNKEQFLNAKEGKNARIL